MTTSTPTRQSWPSLAALGIPLMVLVWAYWTTFGEMAQVWANNSSYSHGYLVPLFALFLLWFRREMVDPAKMKPSFFGLVLVALAVVMRIGGTYYFFSWLDPLSIVPAVAGIFLMVGGWHALHWAWPASLFLFFMIPLPFSLQSQMSGPLQHFATICSTYLLQVVGMPALSEGNTILINDSTIGVVEACSGLRMLMVFYALSCGMALVIQRPWFEKLVLVFSAIPIALAVNILRITVTGILHESIDSETANAFFHDLAGWVMMPAALALLWAEYKLLTRIFILNDGSTEKPAPGKPVELQPVQKVRSSARPGQARPTVTPIQRERSRQPSLSSNTTSPENSD